MRTKSRFEFVCAQCGAAIVTETATGTCPKCGVEYRIEWAVPYVSEAEVVRELE